jgi:hypothetical protein
VVKLRDNAMLSYFRIYESQIPNHLAAIVPPRISTGLPSYRNDWRGIYTGHARLDFTHDDDSWDDDDVNPISFWRFPSVPAHMRKMVKEYDKSCLNQEVLQ